MSCCDKFSYIEFNQVTTLLFQFFFNPNAQICLGFNILEGLMVMKSKNLQLYTTKILKKQRKVLKKNCPWVLFQGHRVMYNSKKILALR